MRQHQKWGKIKGALGRFSACQDSFQTVGLGLGEERRWVNIWNDSKSSCFEKKKKEKKNYFIFSPFLLKYKKVYILCTTLKNQS